MKKNKFSLVLLLSLMSGSLIGAQTDTDNNLSNLKNSMTQETNLESNDDIQTVEGDEQEPEEEDSEEILRPSIEEQSQPTLFEKDIQEPKIITNTLSNEMKSTLSLDLDKKTLPEESKETTTSEKETLKTEEVKTDKSTTIVEYQPDISFLPQAKIYGGWEGVAAEQKKEIMSSDTWKELKADHKNATDPEIYRLYIAETTTAETKKSSAASEKKSAADNTVKKADTSIKATPEELYVQVLREAQPNASDAQVQTALEEFRSAMSRYVKDFAHSDKDDFSNSISIAPEKPVIKEPVKEQTTESTKSEQKIEPVKIESVEQPVESEIATPTTKDDTKPVENLEEQPKSKSVEIKTELEKDPAEKELVEMEASPAAPEKALPVAAQNSTLEQLQVPEAAKTVAEQKAEIPVLDLPEPQF